jgi:hypothetical protein
MRIYTPFGRSTTTISTGVVATCLVDVREGALHLDTSVWPRRASGRKFAHHKLSRYQQFLVEYAKGTPIVFFIIPPEKRGKPNAAQFHKIEKFLINLGLTANPKLLNQHFTNPENWGIRGVVRGGKGKTAQGAVSFRQMMGIVR